MKEVLANQGRFEQITPEKNWHMSEKQDVITYFNADCSISTILSIFEGLSHACALFSSFTVVSRIATVCLG